MARMLQALKNLEARLPKRGGPEEPAAIIRDELVLEPPPAGDTAVRAGWTIERLAAALQLPEVVGESRREGVTGVQGSGTQGVPGVQSSEVDRGQGTGERREGTADRGQGDGGGVSAVESQWPKLEGQGEVGVVHPEVSEPAPAKVAKQVVQARSPLERSVRASLSEPERARALAEMAECLGREATQGGSKSALLIGVGLTCGVHETLLAIAAVLAEQRGEVVVVDANLATGALSRGMEAEQEPGLVELLRSKDAPRQCCRPTAFPGLSVLPTGQIRPLDLSSAGPRLEEIMRQLSEEFSLVLVEGGRSGDPTTPALARLCDATYFVVQLGVVEANEAQATLRDYRAMGARVLGCIAT